MRAPATSATRASDFDTGSPRKLRKKCLHMDSAHRQVSPIHRPGDGVDFVLHVRHRLSRFFKILWTFDELVWRSSRGTVAVPSRQDLSIAHDPAKVCATIAVAGLRSLPHIRYISIFCKKFHGTWIFGHIFFENLALHLRLRKLG